MPSKKAVVVGINYADTEAELHGAVNDALCWSQVLKDYGFPEDNVWTMIDEYPSGELVDEKDEKYSIPTQDNILQALSWLTSDVSEGDSLAFVYCGQATQVQGFASSQPVEEALCPSDWDVFRWGIVPYRVITDQDLHPYFAALPAGVMLSLILDAAFVRPPVQVPMRRSMEYPSHEQRRDTLPKDDIGEQSAWLDNQHVNALPRRLPYAIPRSLWAWSRSLLPPLPHLQKPLDEGLVVFCITACGWGQSGLEAYLDGMQQGVLTFCLLQALKNKHRDHILDWMQAASEVAAKLRGQVMPAMNQFFEIAYGRHLGPDEGQIFDSRCALVAKERAKRRRGQASK
mmetsp:Transcript_64733/g.152204  ORF Transcript_64733/g.152204 Transcript_64733/m.152204 type:complete len:343 (+) Transcript_64733:58-1086(+)